MDAKFDGKPFTPIAPDAAASLEQRSQAYQELFQTTASASAKMTADQQQFFYEHVSFPLLIDWRQSKAAVALIKALAEPDAAAARRLCFLAFDDLKALEDDIKRAERPPFDGWYRKTWIRSDESPYNIHRSYEHTRSFLIAHFLKP